MSDPIKPYTVTRDRFHYEVKREGERVYVGDAVIMNAEQLARILNDAYTKGAQSAAQWLPMESAPKDGTRILIRHVALGHPPVYIGHWVDTPHYDSWEVAECAPDDATRFIEHPTGWMPLPS